MNETKTLKALTKWCLAHRHYKGLPYGGCLEIDTFQVKEIVQAQALIEESEDTKKKLTLQ